MPNSVAGSEGGHGVSLGRPFGAAVAAMFLVAAASTPMVSSGVGRSIATVRLATLASDLGGVIGVAGWIVLPVLGCTLLLGPLAIVRRTWALRAWRVLSALVLGVGLLAVVTTWGRVGPAPVCVCAAGSVLCVSGLRARSTSAPKQYE